MMNSNAEHNNTGSADHGRSDTVVHFKVNTFSQDRNIFFFPDALHLA